ncbi:MAG: hypothetical protein HY791_07495 [Deltaproteobacteria bacterium]|nr:hypothetical protein [Deltaproteobacteria bacterium]
MNTKSIALLILSPLVPGLFVPGLALAYAPVKVESPGTIRGTIHYLKAVPEPRLLEINKDKAYCEKRAPTDESVLVSPAKGLKNVVVFIQKIEKGNAVTPTEATLDNDGCSYKPHVQALAVGSVLGVRNSDPILHNTHARAKSVDVFNYGLPNQGEVVKKTISQKGMIELSCDAGHKWMKGYIAVFDHPYFAVTDVDGGFVLQGVPSGSYTLAYWHEKLGQRTKKLELGAGETIDGSLDF